MVKLESERLNCERRSGIGSIEPDRREISIGHLAAKAPDAIKESFDSQSLRRSAISER